MAPIVPTTRATAAIAANLLWLIAGFGPQASGRVLIDGEDIARLPPWQRNVGMVFQNYALWPHMTVRKNVAFGLEERKLRSAEVCRRVDAALEMVGLRELAERRPSQLWGEQQQRVALARNIVIEPRVLLLDEPLSNLDANLRIRIRSEIRGLQRRLKTMTVFVTHGQKEADTISDRMAVLNEGSLQQVGLPWTSTTSRAFWGALRQQTRRVQQTGMAFAQNRLMLEYKA